MNLRILIIEDEKLTAADLATTIQRARPDVSIIGILGSVAEGKKSLFFSAAFRRSYLLRHPTG